MDEAPLTHETASLLATLRVAGAPLLASLPSELLHGIFTAGGLDQAYGWRFEEQRKTDRSLIADATCIVGNFVDNTHEEGPCYRLEGLGHRTLQMSHRGVYDHDVVPVIEVNAFRFRFRTFFGTNRGYFMHGCWQWSYYLNHDPQFQSLLGTTQMREWLKHCEEHFCK